MRDAFSSFCGALFNRDLREVAVRELRHVGILDSARVPESADAVLCAATGATDTEGMLAISLPETPTFARFLRQPCLG